MMSTQERKRKMSKKTDHRDVQCRYSDGGEQEIKNMIAEGVSNYVFKTALKNIKQRDPVSGETFEFYLKKNGVLSDNRGPSKPTAGERRVYSVQEHKGTFFVRIPVAVLGVTPQELLEAEFRSDRIIIRNV